MLGDDGGVDVTHSIAFFLEQFPYMGKQFYTAYAFVLWVCVREMFADVAESGGTEQCITYSMNEHVGITVAQ